MTSQLGHYSTVHVGLYVMHVLYTARISNVKSLLCHAIKKERKIGIQYFIVYCYFHYLSKVLHKVCVILHHVVAYVYIYLYLGYYIDCMHFLQE